MSSALELLPRNLLYKRDFFLKLVLISCVTQGGSLLRYFIILLGIKFLNVLRSVSLKRSTCLFTSRGDRAPCQSNNDIARLISSK